MAELIPAILTRDPEEVKEKLKFLDNFPQLREVQVDFEDGRFVENTTVMPKDLWGIQTRFAIEAHMMVSFPQAYFHDLEILGIKRIILHRESFTQQADLLTSLSNAKVMGFERGVAINPQIDISVFDDLVGLVEVFLLMCVEPGFQGRKFIPNSLDRLFALRERHKDAIIEVDGGINLDNIESVVGQGADRVVVGAGIWQTPDAEQTIQKFLKLLRTY